MWMTQPYFNATLEPAKLQTQAETLIKRIHSWFANINLTLNLEKTETVTFSLKKRDENKNIRFLGVYLDNKLTWKSHIMQLTNKLSSILYLMRRIANLAPTAVTRMAYMGLFQSRLSYGLLFWGNSTEWIHVFKMQKTALRIIGNKKALDSCRELFKQFQILTLPGLYIHQCLTYIKTHELKFPAVNSRHNYNTRHGENLLLPQHRLTLTDKSYINIAIKLFNALPHYIKILPIMKFKGQTKRLIMEISPYTLQEFFSSEYLKN